MHPAPAAGSASRRPAPMIAGLIGALAGAALVGAVWLGAALVGGQGGARADAAAACDLLGDLPVLTEARMAAADAYRVSAAYSLAEAAAAADNRYRPLAAKLSPAWRAAQTGDSAAAAVDAARQQCDAL